MIQRTIVLITGLLVTFSLFSQALVDDPKLKEYRKGFESIDTLMQNGILMEDVSGLQYFTGYEYKTLYDWDQYFEAIVQIYMGWPSDYIRNGVIIFLQNQQDNGFIALKIR